MNNSQEFNDRDDFLLIEQTINIVLRYRFTVAFGVIGLCAFACIGSLIDDRINLKGGI